MAIAVIVDYNEDGLQFSLSILKRVGQFEDVYGFSCPDEACCFIKERGCDVLFVETEVKGLNCFVLINKLRKIKQDILFIIMALNEDYAYEAFQKGVIGYVLKPLSLESIAKTIEKLEKLHRSQRRIVP